MPLIFVLLQVVKKFDNTTWLFTGDPYEWTYAIECGKSVNVIYLDFSEEFDHVPHACLVSKLSGYGIDGLSLKWIDDFLTDWKRVCVRDSYSSWCNVTSYVPQGSVFCLLFI